MPSKTAPTKTSADPTLSRERALVSKTGRLVIGCDEVGRGAIAGPVAVGVAVVDPAKTRKIPVGLRDSKLLSEAKREEIYPRVRDWAKFSAVGLASADEVDFFGLTACLGLAAKRALLRLAAQGCDISGAVILLDGSHDYVSSAMPRPVTVATQIKADRLCASVAAASVLAKVSRDRLMVASDSDIPGYGWTSNKGYGSTSHMDAIRNLGPSTLHRLTWLRRDASGVAPSPEDT